MMLFYADVTVMVEIDPYAMVRKARYQGQPQAKQCNLRCTNIGMQNVHDMYCNETKGF